MNKIRNHITLIGNLGQDPELKTFDSGNKVARFTLATDEVYRNKAGDKVTTTQWHNIVAWGKTGELLADLVSKGKKVAVMGRLTYRSFEDKNGQKRSVPEIVVDDFALMSKSEGAERENQK